MKSGCLLFIIVFIAIMTSSQTVLPILLVIIGVIHVNKPSFFKDKLDSFKASSKKVYEEKKEEIKAKEETIRLEKTASSRVSSPSLIAPADYEENKRKMRSFEVSRRIYPENPGDLQLFIDDKQKYFAFTYENQLISAHSSDPIVYDIQSVDFVAHRGENRSMWTREVTEADLYEARINLDNQIHSLEKDEIIFYRQILRDAKHYAYYEGELRFQEEHQRRRPGRTKHYVDIYIILSFSDHRADQEIKVNKKPIFVNEIGAFDRYKAYARKIVDAIASIGEDA